MRYVVPVVAHWPGTLIAVNVGGAVLPTLMSIYLLVRNQLWIQAALATAVIAAVCYWLSRPIPGLGIAESQCLFRQSRRRSSRYCSHASTPRSSPISAVALAHSSASICSISAISVGWARRSLRLCGAGTFDGIFLI